MMIKQLQDNLISGFKKVVSNTGLKNLVIGLSGGVDSAVAAAIACHAIGKDHVFPFAMPYKSSNPASAKDAASVAAYLGIPLTTIDITPPVDAYISTQPDMTAARAGNIMARMRMITLFDQSVRHNALVVGTGNRSEILLGYMTLFGDSACSLNPLGDIYKTEVWELAKTFGLPQQVITKAPSADLCEGQTDESDFGFTYLEADKLLRFLCDEKHTADDAVKAGFPGELIKKVIKRINDNAFKSVPPVIISRHGAVSAE